jgi:hypothetical protein
MTYDDAPPPNNRGCVIVGVTAFLVALALVGVGLFLPPFSLFDRLFGEEYTTLQTSGASVATTDGAFRVLALADSAGFGVRVGGVSLRDFTLDDGTLAAWIPASRASIPPHLALQSAVYSLRWDDRQPSAMAYELVPPPNTRPELLDVYAYDEGRGRWEFVPSQPEDERVRAFPSKRYDRVAFFQPAPLAPKLVLEYEVTQFLTEDIAKLAHIVTPSGLQPMLNGALTGSLAGGFSLNATYDVMPIVRDFADPRALDTETVTAIISNRTLRDEHVRQLASLSAGGFKGVWIDYRGLDASQRENFSAFIRALGARLDGVGLALGVVVPPAVWRDGAWDTGAYDWRVIGASADYVQLKAQLDPQAFLNGEDQPMNAILRYAVSQINRYKLVLGLSASSVREVNGSFTRIGYDEALAALGDVVVTADRVNEQGILQPNATLRARLNGQPAVAGVDLRLNAPFLDYLDARQTPVARMWLSTASALRWRMDAGARFALGGVAFDDLLSDDLAGDALPAIADYLAQLPSLPSPTSLALRWRIEGADGALIQEAVTGLGEPLLTTINAPDGNYAVNVAVVGVGEAIESVRSGASVAFFRPTATPTPLPTPTPTPLPTITPTPAPIVATQAPAPVAGGPASNFPVVAPGAGSIRLGQFEYGGQVTDAGSGRAIDAMRRAGMTWMKLQVRYSSGAGFDQAQGAIGAARANGFKILLSVVGSPSELGSGGDGFINGFASWLGTVASFGPDAIEVWNEPNIDREWPRGQISGAYYASMLQRAYSAIKRANPSVLVITAAPAPTGAEAAYPGAVMNDDRWLRQVVEAGGLGYADCVGVHYNEGIVPPSATSGDPRDNYYTRYFPLVINTYWNIIGGQKPLCITEMGYVTPEGYPPLDPYFAWGSNTTVAQQAAWLAEAAALSSQSGRVRMLIVWNVDFTSYGTDPMAGYAIIRPDGSCPACNALAGAR